MMVALAGGKVNLNGYSLTPASPFTQCGGGSGVGAGEAHTHPGSAQDQAANWFICS